MTAEVMDRVVELWGQMRPDGSYAYKPGVEASVVREALEIEFGAEEVHSALGQYLLKHGRREAAQESFTRRETWLTNSTFLLCAPANERRLDRETVAELVCTLPSVGFYSLLQPWVKTYFQQAPLLRSLAEGIRGATSPITRASALFGLRMYLGVAEPSSDSELEEGIREFEAALRTQTDDSDVIVAETVNGALKQLWAMRATRPWWSRITPAELRAYRHEHGDHVTHTVERLADGYIVLRISRFEVSDGVLFIEYKNQEPSLLPEAVPSMLRATLLANHISASEAAQVKHVHFIDERLQRSSDVLAADLPL